MLTQAELNAIYERLQNHQFPVGCSIEEKEDCPVCKVEAHIEALREGLQEMLDAYELFHNPAEVKRSQNIPDEEFPLFSKRYKRWKSAFATAKKLLEDSQ